ncbi:trigger factor [Mycoplasmopsis iners]|uniref:trigger factor n=1 Tax=Mycoplasmopsis iners TaxID=76630 RepID=UPI000496211A|nr:trigger factor [Mycoplasmopsis iners]
MSNKTIVLDAKNSEISKLVEVKGKDWEDLVKKAKKEISSKLKIKGYRPGKAPQNIIDKHINMGDVLNRAVNMYISANHTKFFDEVKAENKRAVNVPSLNVESISETELKMQFVYPLETDLDNVDYTKSDAKFVLDPVNDEAINKYMSSRLNSDALLMPLGDKDLTQLGDTVTIDYKGYVNDEPFEGGEAENYPLQLGSKTFIDTFEDQLVGKKVGWKGEVVVTFPESYPVAKLAGQKAQFDVTIKEAKRPQEIKLNEENVSLLNLGDKVKTVEDAKKIISVILQKQYALLSLDKYIDQLFADVIANNEINVHKNVLGNAIAQKKNQIKALLKQQNVKFQEYLELLGQNEEQLDELIAKEELLNVKRSLVIGHLIEELRKDIKVEEKDFEELIKFHALSSGISYDVVNSFFNSTEQSKQRLALQIEDLKVKQAILAKYNSKGAEEFAKALADANKAIDQLVEVKATEETKADEAKKEK